MSAPRNDYDRDAAYYDAWNTRTDDIGFWSHLAGQAEGTVLEVGAGTGRLTVPLALAGIDVHGIDPSEAMLARARQRADREGARVEFTICAAESAPALGRTFPLLFLPADVFLNCASLAEQHAWCCALATVVEPGGSLAIDVPGPAMWLDPSLDGAPVLVHSGPFEGGHLDVWQVTWDDLAEQSRLLRITYDLTAPDGSLTRSYSEHELRYVYPTELRLHLESAGLELLDLFGDYEFGPLSNGSERMIAIARRPSQ